MSAFSLEIAGFHRWTRGPDGALPACSEVPSLLRRRFSALSRIAIHLGTEVLRDQELEASEPLLVLASRHGEIEVLARVLEQLHLRQPVSPTQFSNSVHHTALGHFSLAFCNRQPARAVAAGDRTWEAGWLETFCAAQAHPGKSVLLVFAEDSFPEDFLGLDGFQQDQASGSAFLLRPAGSSPRSLGTIRLEPAATASQAFSREAVENWLGDSHRESLVLVARGTGLRLDPVYPPFVELVPHKPPMVLLDRVVLLEHRRGVAAVRIRPGIPFFRDGGVGALTGIEYFAQTVAALSGWEHRRDGKPPRIGFLLSVREYSSDIPVFSDGTDLLVEVVHSWGDGDMLRFDGRIHDAASGREIARGVLNVFGPDDPGSFLENA